jgi:hypothetical protein
MKHGFRLFLVLCLGLVSLRSMAAADNYVSVNCGKEHVLIKSDYAEGLPPLANSSDFYLKNYGQTNECRLKSGAIVRVRLGFEFHGERNAQVSWVSIWFDRKKWLSSMKVEVDDAEDIRAHTIDVSASGISICTVHGPIGQADDENNGDKKQTQATMCKSIKRSQLSKSIDTNETKLVDASENPIPSPAILFGRGKTLCEKMIAINKKTLISGVEPVEHLWLNFPTNESLRINPEPGSSGKEWAISSQIDIDNGGTFSHVYRRSQSMGYWEHYDIYVVLDDKDYQRFLLTKMTDEDLLENAETVWPMDWSGHPNRLEAEKNMKGLVIPLSIDGGPFEKDDIPDNQVSIVPFAYEDQTHLLLSNNQSKSDAMAFVVKPHPHGTFDQECVFRAPITNF